MLLTISYSIVVAATLLNTAALGSIGCGKSHGVVGYNNNLQSHQVTSGGILRNYTIFIPTTYNDGDPVKT